MTLDEFLKHLRSRVDAFGEYYRDGISNGVAGEPDTQFDSELNLADWMEQFIIYDELSDE